MTTTHKFPSQVDGQGHGPVGLGEKVEAETEEERGRHQEPHQVHHQPNLDTAKDGLSFDSR